MGKNFSGGVIGGKKNNKMIGGQEKGIFSSILKTGL